MGNELNAALTAVLPLIESLFALGVPGILLLLASIPALAVALVFVLDYRHGNASSACLPPTARIRRKPCRP